ncbi:MAG: SDR family NAD(P)-dependent oxidoreductase, partial [Anaerolineales bacterium]|nr:SDR family NAD(P)-dependent oxidoreductase [Anaerolineales bacterium]
MSNKMRFQGKVALVTGSGRGIGKATLMRFAEEGASGVVVVDLMDERLDQASSDLSSLGADVLTFKADVTNYSDVKHVVRSTVDRFGHIDILVNNVGASWGATGLSVTEKDWDDIIDVNLKSQFMCIKEAVPHMKDKEYGRIINLSSSAGKYRSQWL